MLSRFLIPIIFLALNGCSTSSPVKEDNLLKTLKKELSRKKIYDDQKELRIKQLKARLAAIPAKTYYEQYNLAGKLYEEYKVYQFDSAHVYAQKLLAISGYTKNAVWEYESKIKLGFILLSSGMFKETFDCLNQIDTHTLNDSAKRTYYALKSRAYADLADYDADTNYASSNNASSIRYLDSAIACSRPNSVDMLMNLGDRQVRSGELQKPSPSFIKLLAHYNLTAHQRAMVATGLSNFYEGPFQSESRTKLLAIGAINDIKSSTKETLAIYKLGEQLYSVDGNVKDSYIFIQQAMDDAQYYGARLRKIKIGAVLAVIAAQKIIISENEKQRFLIYFLSIAAVAILIALLSFMIFIQLRRLKIKEKIIEDKNVQLEIINDKLTEDTHIKEEYIGYFFNLISGYILKLEKLKRTVERKIATRKYEEILETVNEINIKKERENLFYTFDRVFLKIFPNFIPVFNSFFKAEDQIWPKDHEVLNTDLRIFALMRLGINDNQTIANILEYSVNTIYVYKMRIKAKAIIPHDEFDNQIMSVKAVDGLKVSKNA